MAGVDAPTLDVEAQKVSYVLLLPFDKAVMGAAVLPFEPETQKVDNVLLSYEVKAVVGAAVLPFVLETQKVDYVLVQPFEKAVVGAAELQFEWWESQNVGYVLPLSFEKGTSPVEDGKQASVGMDEECMQICSYLAASQFHHPSRLS